MKYFLPGLAIFVLAAPKAGAEVTERGWSWAVAPVAYGVWRSPDASEVQKLRASVRKSFISQTPQIGPQEPLFPIRDEPDIAKSPSTPEGEPIPPTVEEAFENQESSSRQLERKDLRLSSSFLLNNYQLPITNYQLPIAQSENSSLAPSPFSLASLETSEKELISDEPMAQVNSVSQLSDVQPTDWAFGALQNLVERYGCIAGYPDGTYRGNRTMTRYEFAAGLNACISHINQLIAAKPTDNLASLEDLATLQRLQAEFAAELATLRGRVDALEARAEQLETQQFSTTAVLGGEVIFALTTAAGGDPPGKGESNTILAQLTRLGIVSTFTGKDRLRLELSTGNFDNRGFGNPNSLNTDMALLAYQADLNNQIQLDKLEYRFAALGDRVVFTFRPVGFSLSSVLTANSPYFDAGRGAISRFAEASPIFKIGSLDAGVGFDWLVADTVRLQVAYGTRNSNSSNAGRGVFGADHSALGVQLLLKPANNVLTGIAYVNAYAENGRLDTFTGSFNADTSGLFNEPAQIHAVSGTLQWRVTPKITLGTWGGVIFTNFQESDASATTTTYLFSLGLSDPFGREGDLLAFLFGQPPKLVNGNNVQEDENTSLHFEVFYRYRLTDNISISPGFFVITNPEHNSENNTIFIGTIRTTFRF